MDSFLEDHKTVRPDYTAGVTKGSLTIYRVEIDVETLKSVLKDERVLYVNESGDLPVDLEINDNNETISDDKLEAIFTLLDGNIAVNAGYDGTGIIVGMVPVLTNPTKTPIPGSFFIILPQKPKNH